MFLHITALSRLVAHSLSGFVARLRRRKAAFVVLTAVVAVGVFGIGHPAHAQVGATLIEFVLSAAGKLLELYLSLVSQLVMFAVNLLIEVAGYNNFINATAVKEGWVIMRDIANMVIVVVLLVIAFGTMLGKEEYHWKQLLPRLIITAIFINFSKTVIGIMIDAGQVVMLTFVNGFAAAAGGNFMNALRLTDTINLVKGSGGVSSAGIEVSNFMAYLLGAITVTIALIVITVFLIILLFRVIALWVLIIFAPLAWVLGTFPKGQEYYAEWWKRLTNQIIVGPILAFFLWLSLVVAGSGQIYNEFSNPETNPLAGKSAAAQEFGKVHGCSSKICEWENLAGYFIAIALLMAGLQFTQELGVAGAGVASGVADKMKGGALALAKFTALTAPRVGLSWGERKAAAMGLTGGIRLNPVLIWQGIKEGFEDKKKKDEAEAKGHTVEAAKTGGLRGAFALATGGTRDFMNEYLNGFMWWKAIPRTFLGKPKDADAAKKEEQAALEDAQRMTPGERAEKAKEVEREREEATAKKNATTLDMSVEENRQRVLTYVAIKGAEEEKLRTEEEQLRKKGKIPEADDLKAKADAIDAEISPMKKLIKAKAGAVTLDPASDLTKEWQADWDEKAKEKSNQHRILTLFDDDRKAEIAMGKVLLDAAQKNGSAKEIDVAKERKTLIKHRNALNTEIEKLSAKGELVAAGKLEDEANKITAALQKGGAFALTPELKFTGEWQKKWATEQERIQSELNALNASRTISVDEKKEAENRYKEARKRRETAEAWTPQAYYIRQEAREHLSEEAKKVETDNAEELQAMARAAEKEHNPDKLVAVMRQAAKVGHLNEIMYAFRDHNGKKFRGDHVGLSNFVNEILVKHMGVSRQMGYGHQQDLSQIAKNMGHWNFAEGMAYDGARFRQRGFDINGKRQADDDDGFGASKEHQKVVYIEKEKVGIDKMLNYNRLAWGPESEDDEGRRTWGFDSSSLSLVRKGWKAMDFKLNRGQVQDNLIRYIMQNKETGYNLLLRLVDQIKNTPEAREKGGAQRTFEQIIVHAIPEAAPRDVDTVDEFMDKVRRMAGRR